MKRAPLTFLLGREHHDPINQGQKYGRSEFEGAVPRLDQVRCSASVELEYNRATPPPDDQDGGDVPKDRVPVVRRFDDRSVECLALQRTPNGKHIS